MLATLAFPVTALHVLMMMNVLLERTIVMPWPPVPTLLAALPALVQLAMTTRTVMVHFVLIKMNAPLVPITVMLTLLVPTKQVRGSFFILVLSFKVLFHVHATPDTLEMAPPVPTMTNVQLEPLIAMSMPFVPIQSVASHVLATLAMLILTGMAQV